VSGERHLARPRLSPTVAGRERVSMLDLIYLAQMLGFGLLSLLLIRGLDRI
jgi:hypothetical protein